MGSKNLLVFTSVGIVAALVFGIFLINFKNSSQLEFVEGSSLSVLTEKTDFKRGESITIRIVNSGTTTLKFSDTSYGLRIVDLVGMNIYSPISSNKVSLLEPRQEVTFTWDQTKNDGSKVIQGVYKIESHGIDDSGKEIKKLHTVNIF